MDYYEFCEKSGWDVSREDYENIIEPLYLKGPDGIVGSYVSEFCQWLKDNDFTLGQLRQITAIVEVTDSARTNAAALQQELRDREAEIMLLRSNEEAVEARLHAIVRCFGEDTIVERMAEDIPADMIIDAYIRAKAVNQ